MKEIVVFDFDKTLTYYDTTLPFFLFCARRQPLSFALVPVFIIVKILSKLNLITVKKEKELGLMFFCPKQYLRFQTISLEFSKHVKLNDVYTDVFCNYKHDEYEIIIASASFEAYLDPLFANYKIVGTTLKVNQLGNITGIIQHPYKQEKANILMAMGFNLIHVFYTDSKNDIPVAKLSENIYRINNNQTLDLLRHWSDLSKKG